MGLEQEGASEIAEKAVSLRMARMTLRDAISRWQHEPHAPANAYDWYRRDALRSGTVFFGALTIPAHKERGTWYVESADFERALIAHRDYRDGVKRATDDLRAGVLHGRDGDRVETEWGHYVRRDPFHFRWDAYAAMRRRSDGAWHCNTCLRPAETEHDAPECHRCSDWGYCGRDCTLSRVFCPTCGTTMDV